MKYVDTVTLEEYCTLCFIDDPSKKENAVVIKDLLKRTLAKIEPSL